MFAGRAWSATPVRVISDTPAALLVSHWPGAQLLSPQSYLVALQSGLGKERFWLIRELAAGSWELGMRPWRDTTVLTRVSLLTGSACTGSMTLASRLASGT
jgi:hypothetical protein